MATSDETLNAYSIDNPHGTKPDTKPEDVSDEPSVWDRLNSQQKITKRAEGTVVRQASLWRKPSPH